MHMIVRVSKTCDLSTAAKQILLAREDSHGHQYNPNLTWGQGPGLGSSHICGLKIFSNVFQNLGRMIEVQRAHVCVRASARACVRVRASACTRARARVRTQVVIVRSVRLAARLLNSQINHHVFRLDFPGHLGLLGEL